MRTTAAVLGILITAMGCASSGRSKSSDTVAGITTIDQELGAAQDQLKKTIERLSAVVENPGPNLNADYDKFQSDLSDLDNKVQHIRDRSVAMQAKRDQYLQHWVQQTSKIQNADLKVQAEARRIALMTEFMDLNAKGATAKKAYAPLQASLHDCDRFLESDLNPAGAKALAGELEKIRTAHKDVDAAVSDYRASLKALADKLAVAVPPAPAPAEKGEKK